MWVFPLVAAVVAFFFYARLLRQFAARGRTYQLVWGIALLMYGVASIVVAIGAATGWTRLEFQLYWALGAVLNVPFLAAGELMLLTRRRSVHAAIVLALVFVTAYTLSTLRGTEIDPGALVQRLPSGKQVFGDGTPAHRLPQLISIPSYLILLGGTLWSAWRMRGRPEFRDRFLGTLMIALGATVIAGFGSAFAAMGNLPMFSLALLGGISMMFAGFLWASHQLPAPVTRSAG